MGFPALFQALRRHAVPTSLFLLSFALHLLPFLLFGPHPLGYDTGFYRRYLIAPFVSFPNPPVPGLGDDAFVTRILLDLVRLSGLPTDIVLYGTYIALWAALPVLAYFFLAPFLGKRWAALAGICALLSPVAYNAYWYFLFKNALGLDLLLLGFIFIERRLFIPLLFIDLVLPLAHKTSAVMYLLTLGAIVIAWKGRRAEALMHGAIAGIVFTLINLPTIHEVSVVLPTAIFITWDTYVPMSVAYIILCLAGWKGFRKRKVPMTLIVFSVASFAYVALRLPFYERIFVFADVALALLAAWGAAELVSAVRWRELGVRTVFSVMALAIAGGLLFGTLVNQIHTLVPLISPAAVARIQEAGISVPENATLLTTADEAPWYEGFTRAHIAAPGLLHDVPGNTLDRWIAFWDATSTDTRIAFLAEFPQPLYVSTLEGIQNLVGAPPPCLTKIGADLWYDACASSR